MLRFVLLGLLDAEPRYGYELKAVFEQFLGGTWQLNIGQIYTTLGEARGGRPRRRRRSCRRTAAPTARSTR